MAPRDRIVSLVAVVGMSLIWKVGDTAMEPWARHSLATPERATSPVIHEGAQAAGATESWWETVSDDIEALEYAATRTTNGLQAPNRAQNLRTYFREGSVEVVPRDASDEANWRITWKTTIIGRTGNLRPVTAATPVANGARVVYRHDGFDEWYHNTRDGVEQGFTVHRRPPGRGSLRIAGLLGGNANAELRDNGALSFLDSGGHEIIAYDKLIVWDDTGRTLPAHLRLDDDVLAILVDDTGATYPIVVDPLMTSPAWTAESNQAYASMGVSVSTAGDVNGDGYGDVIVGAPDYDNGETDEGRAFVYHGSANGLLTTAAWTAESNQANSHFGYSVSTAGDVNGDGYSDVIVGAPDYGAPRSGRVYVYHGSVGGLPSSVAWITDGYGYDPPSGGAQLGYSVSTAGDVNGDGYSDVIVGAPNAYTPEDAGAGMALVYHGSATGLSASTDWEKNVGQLVSFGSSVSTAGDVNGDGYSDVIVGAQTSSVPNFWWDTSVYLGSAAGLSTTASWSRQGSMATTLPSVSTVSTAGDVNGDGYSDIIVGVSGLTYEWSGEGHAYVYHGSAGGLQTTPAWLFADFDQSYGQFGISVSTAGDINGDGYSDVVVGTPLDTYEALEDGSALVYHGSADGLLTTVAWTAGGGANQHHAQFGISVSTAGDVNGDGYSDVIVGAPDYDNGETDEGRVFVYHGGPDLYDRDNADWSNGGNQADGYLGYSVSTAGDVNGDGYDDMIVGAWGYDAGQTDEGRVYVYHGSENGPYSAIPVWYDESDQTSSEFGASVSTAGDVNGDGYEDIIVGASNYDDGEEDEGAAFVYHGSASGLPTSPDWVAGGDQAFANFGRIVSTAGDVNGDGYADVIVQAHRYDNGETDEGRAFVYHGSLSGLSPTPDWTVESDQVDAKLWSVSTAGDVNGDGYSDVIIGIPLFDSNDGKAEVYLGSASGLQSTPAWSVTGGAGIGGQFGNDVSTAGDVNGDGYSDVVIGALASPGVFVYYGSSSGLTATASWIWTSNEGWDVSTAGDMNGDGFSEIIIGDPDAGGTARVFYGSDAGPITPPRSSFGNTITGQTTNYGQSASTAGDVNGDGYADIIVGASLFDNGQADEGGVFFFYGADGPDHRSVRPRQFLADGVTPIPPGGHSDDETGFRLKGTVVSAFGRTDMRAELEIKPLGTPFDGQNLIVSGWQNTGVSSEVDFDLMLTQLDPGTAYHWRVRGVYDLASMPWQRNGPWRYNVRRGDSETHVWTAGSVSTGIANERKPGRVPRFELSSAYPNPASGRAHVSLTLNRPAQVYVDVFDVAGRRVGVLSTGARRDEGVHELTWDGRDRSGANVPSGVYFIRVRSQEQTQVRKLVIVR